MPFENLPSAIFSPAKVVFISYSVLAYADKIETSKAEFIVFSVLFFVAQVYHDDYLRIRLNERARQTGHRSVQAGVAVLLGALLLGWWWSGVGISEEEPVGVLRQNMTMLEVEQLLGKPDRVEVEDGRIDGDLEHPKVIRWIYGRYRMTDSGEAFGKPGHVNFIPLRFTELAWNDQRADETGRENGEQSDVFRTYSLTGSFPITRDDWKGAGLFDGIPLKDVK